MPETQASLTQSLLAFGLAQVPLTQKAFRPRLARIPSASRRPQAHHRAQSLALTLLVLPAPQSFPVSQV